MSDEGVHYIKAMLPYSRSLHDMLARSCVNCAPLMARSRKRRRGR